MATIRVKAKDLPRVVAREVRNRLSNPVVASVLVDLAKKRIVAGRDSTVTYPELWSTKSKIGFRKGGQPLRDTGRLVNMLSVKVSNTPRGVRWTLTDGTGYGIKHQKGFVNKAPIAVPLNAKTKRVIPSESPHDIKALESLGLRRAKTKRDAMLSPDKFDFYVLENDARVPARPIANDPPEDIKEITGVIKDALVGV